MKLLLTSRRGWAVLFALWIGLSTLFGGCSHSAQTPSPTGDPADKPPSLTITDLAGRTVTVPQPIRHVAAYDGALRLYLYVDGAKRLAGVEESEHKRTAGKPYNVAFFDELSRVPAIGPGGANSLPNAEQLAEVKPDVLFATISAKDADTLQTQTGIPVVLLSYGAQDALEDSLFASLRLLGQVLGKEERAEAIVRYILETKEDVERRSRDIPDEAKKSVYVGGVSMRGAHGIESTQTNFLPFVLNHAKNVAAELSQKGTVMVDREKIIAWNPEIVFLDNIPIIQKDYAENPTFYQNIRAFREGNVYRIYPYVHRMTNIETVFVDAYLVGKVLYPERFTDVDVRKKAEEIYAFFFGEKGKGVLETIERELGPAGKIDLRSEKQ